MKGGYTMRCDRVWFNPWESPETSPWKNFWDEDFWNNCVLASANRDGNDVDGNNRNHHRCR